MKKVLHFPDARRARNEACKWLARLDRGLSANESEALNDWLSADAAHSRILVEMAVLWDETNVLSELSDLFPLESQRTGFGRRRTPLPATVAASTVLLGWIVLFTGDEPARHARDHESMVASQQSYETAVGEHSTATLEDGSRLTLNTNSLLDVRFTAVERVVILRRGEGHFDVTPDPARPFSVHAGSHIVQAIGTAFNVQLGQNGELDVTVTEGQVRVLLRTDAESSDSNSELTVRFDPYHDYRDAVDTTLSAGQSATFGEDIQVERLDTDEIEVRLAWQQEMLIFRGESLDQVLREVSRYTDTEFVFATEAIRNIRVGGYFRTGDVDGLLVALRNNFAIDSERIEDNQIILTGQ